MSARSIEHFADLIPRALFSESGKVFYSGRLAFSEGSALYVLGVNPGGDPENYRTQTVERHTRQVVNEFPADWSAYRDEVWEGALPGTYGMAPRILHLLRQLDLNPGAVPASNLIFVRSLREEHIRARQGGLADMCWPFHARVIAELQPRLVLCLGGTAGRYICQKLGATELIDEFIEQNDRRWRSRCFSGASGARVLVATHPSIADWTAPATDPSALIKRALSK
ncbi:hypothetical protein B188_03060 [Candidatus Brocadiaceae bacterium B188]|nr:MAG: hypothetical protein EX330_03360 [Candidatus Brocadia sp. BROELEC01]TWU52353.1 hypothetical protein B188_03060 [Candidatus Brocadiaceae bacterium B188]